MMDDDCGAVGETEAFFFHHKSHTNLTWVRNRAAAVGSLETNRLSYGVTQLGVVRTTHQVTARIIHEHVASTFGY